MSHADAARLLILGLATSSLLIAGCETMSETEKGTAAGAGMGAAAGAIISAGTGGNAATGAAVGGILGAVAGNVWSTRQEARRTEMEQAARGTGVEVSRTADNQLKLNVPSDISFDINSAAIKPELRGVLDAFSASLRGDANVRLNIVGHTDSTGSEAINNRLSLERAHSVRDYLSDRGISAARINTSGRGEREPVADNASEAGRARNRRVEIYLREPEQPH